MEYRHQLEGLWKEAVGLRLQGRGAEAETLEAKAAQILEELKVRAEQSPDDLLTADALLFLAEREWSISGDQPDVLAKIQQALSLREKKLGAHDRLTGEALTKLAEFHYLAGRFGEAEPHYRRAVSILEKHGMPKDPVLAQSLQGLAQTLSILSRPAEADPYFAKAIEMAPSDEPGKRSLYFLYIYRAEGLEKLNRGAEAEQLRQQAAALLPKTNPGEFGYQATPPSAQNPLEI